MVSVEAGRHGRGKLRCSRDGTDARLESNPDSASRRELNIVCTRGAMGSIEPSRVREILFATKCGRCIDGSGCWFACKSERGDL